MADSVSGIPWTKVLERGRQQGYLMEPGQQEGAWASLRRFERRIGGLPRPSWPLVLAFGPIPAPPFWDVRWDPCCCGEQRHFRRGSRLTACSLPLPYVVAVFERTDNACS